MTEHEWQQRRVVSTDRTDPWADIVTLEIPTAATADAVRGEVARRLGIDGSVRRVELAEGGRVLVTLRYSRGD